MATINQLVSEIAHSIKQADNVAARKSIKLGIIHARNTLIRQSYEHHNYIDKGLQQRFKIELIDVPDGDLYQTSEIINNVIKRSKNKVPKPVRLTNNLPFHSIRTIGAENPIEIAYVKEASSKFYAYLPGICKHVTYDYINGYLYINVLNDTQFANIENIIIESVFEYPTEISIETNEDIIKYIDDNDEFLISEDMIDGIKKLVLETFNSQISRDTNEPNPINLVK